MKPIFACLTLVFSLSVTLGCQPILRLYNDKADGSVTKEFLAVYSQPNLAIQNITIERLYTCPEGVWMAYRNEDFTGAEGERYVLSGPRDGIFNCTFEGEGREKRIIRSVKVVGNPEDYTASAVVTYLRSNNEGSDLTYLQDTAKTNTTFQSLILVGQEEIELFTEEDFQGQSHCVSPNRGDISKRSQLHGRGKTFWNGDEMYTNIKDLEAIFGESNFKSFRFGCENKLKRGKFL